MSVNYRPVVQRLGRPRRILKIPVPLWQQWAVCLFCNFPLESFQPPYEYSAVFRRAAVCILFWTVLTGGDPQRFLRSFARLMQPRWRRTNPQYCRFKLHRDDLSNTTQTPTLKNPLARNRRGRSHRPG